jgi:hypothetical protein
MVFRLIAVLWLAISSIFIGKAMQKHVIPLRMPENLDKLAMPFAEDRRDDSDLVAMHILDPRCNCSAQILESLVRYNQSKHLIQNYVVATSELDESIRNQLTQSGVSIRNLDADKLESEYGIESVPWLVMLDHQRQTIYAGGYGAQRITSAEDFQLEKFVDQVLNASLKDAFPSFGCLLDELSTGF